MIVHNINTHITSTEVNFEDWSLFKENFRNRTSKRTRGPADDFDEMERIQIFSERRKYAT
jgi:hypothetical protein